MIIFPAIDVMNKRAVRLFKGDYEQKTEYGEPSFFAEQFKSLGATHIHTVDLDGAKEGKPINFDTIVSIKEKTGLFVEVGGGIRNAEIVDRYVNSGIDRVILGTSAVSDADFLKTIVKKYKDKIAVGADVKDGFIAVKGWTEKSNITLFAFLEKMALYGVKTVICTDVSKDGALKGTNLDLYGEITSKFDLNLIASGGVSSLEDIIKLKTIGVYGAIVGKAYYSGKISLKDAIEVSK